MTTLAFPIRQHVRKKTHCSVPASPLSEVKHTTAKGTVLLQKTTHLTLKLLKYEKIVFFMLFYASCMLSDCRNYARHMLHDCRKFILRHSQPWEGLCKYHGCSGNHYCNLS